jgi:hypothetical protein
MKRRANPFSLSGCSIPLNLGFRFWHFPKLLHIEELDSPKVMRYRWEELHFQHNRKFEDIII